ncbi:hypothetical protein WJU23_14495 [Prosthecobacter sp. SYSU 5D2]|uniref:hypothetical protein n=1 Tax=Prosthecobacter sp. SYSU 5D2 TaxID=3134134 RepID=UPI0031FF25B5
MANVYTDYAEAQKAALKDFSAAPNLRQHGGDLKFMDVEVTAVMDTDDPLHLLRLPKGARLVPELCSVTFGNPGAALTGKIGLFTDEGVQVGVDAILTTLATGGAAGHKRFDEATTKGPYWLAPVPMADDAWVVVTWTEASTTQLSHKQTWHLAYVMG